MATIEVREYQHKTPSGEAKTIKKYKATITLKGCPRTSKTFDRKGVSCPYRARMA